MLIGRDYRKTISQGIAFGLFRWVAIWFLVGACVSYGPPVGYTGAIVIIAVDIITQSHFQAMALRSAAHQRTQWMDTLTNRIFYKLLWEDIQTEGAGAVDIDGLFTRANREANADIKKADEDSKLESGWLDSLPWHWFGGVLSLVGQIFWFWVYYGSAFYVFAKSPY